MKFLRFYCTIVLLTVVVGCEHDSFEVEVRPDGDGFDRKLTCWHMGGEDTKTIQPLSEKKLTRLRDIYTKCESPEDEGAAKQVFSGRFAETTPPDVGGAGRYTRFTSPLGSSSCYVERFRGNDDLEANLSVRREAADRLTDVLVGWLSMELGQDPGFPSLKEFLDKNLRQDLKNLGTYLWVGEAKDRDGDNGNGDNGNKVEFILRMGLYLCERGYFSPQQVPSLCRSVAAMDAQPLFDHVQRLLARKMGVDDNEPIPPSLAFLADASAVRASFEKFAQSDFRVEKVAPARKTRKDVPKANDEEALAKKITGLLCDLVSGDDEFFTSPDSEDSLELKVFCGRKPYATNGDWDEETHVAVWRKRLPERATLPVICFASWSTPDQAVQEKHFGKVILTDKALMEFAVWYRLLKPEEAKEWDQFIDGLKPGSG